MQRFDNTRTLFFVSILTEVLTAFYNVFWIVLLMQPLCALAFIFDGVFKGLGKMKYLNVCQCYTCTWLHLLNLNCITVIV